MTLTDTKLKARMRINANGRAVIPAELRKRLGIRAGDELELRLADNELRITTLRPNLPRARKLLRRPIKSSFFGLALGDRACLALALSLHAPIYTADSSWSKLKIAARIHLIR